MSSTRSFNIIHPTLTLACLLGFAMAVTGSELTNSAVTVSVEQLLQNKGRWQSNKVDVSGYYTSSFEYSVLTPRKGDAPDKGVWVDRFRLAPNSKGKIKWIPKGTVRLIGTFRVAETSRSGHLGICPAEITQIEVFEPTGHVVTNDLPSRGSPLDKPSQGNSRR